MYLSWKWSNKIFSVLLWTLLVSWVHLDCFDTQQFTLTRTKYLKNAAGSHEANFIIPPWTNVTIIWPRLQFLSLKIKTETLTLKVSGSRLRLKLMDISLRLTERQDYWLWKMMRPRLNQTLKYKGCQTVADWYKVKDVVTKYFQRVLLFL